MSCSSRIADRRAERIAYHFTNHAGRRSYRAERSPPECRQQYTWFWPEFVRIAGAPTYPDRPSRRLCLSRAPDGGSRALGVPSETGWASLDRLLEIALEVRRAGAKPGVRGRGDAALAELRFLGVVSAKLRAEVLPGGRAPKFNVAVTGTERLSAEHAATRAAVDEIPAAHEHRSPPPNSAVLPADRRRRVVNARLIRGMRFPSSPRSP
jgi:hypothetical protein